MTDPQGLDTAVVADWLAQQSPDAVAGPFEASLITGGKSNLTYLVTDGAHDYVVRRPPLGHVLATAHDMAREYRVMAALAPTPVPVPRMVALCEDTEVIGAPFYVMERVPGTAYARATQLEALGADRTRAITERMVDTLVALHAVDHEAVGLGDFGRPDGYIGRQVSRWKKQLAASTSRELPGMDELVAYLDANIPASGDGTIVHGDFRLDNLLVDTDPASGQDEVTAVLDWEMSTLGDPLSDVALMLAYQQLGESAPPSEGAVVTDAPLAAGYLGREETIARYAAGSGRDVSDIGFHLSLAFFKLAVILEGIHFRHSHGQTVGSGFDGIGDMIIPLIDAGRAASR
ncbi:phosphotransferase family protein [Aeromicrobium stalagmiti]|uniref:phosphotransferase family protein n=1 Tax=Aeromicrobium stalagmiti TaxID=2738988 RepID=UPI001569DA5B|nr:phosphotransferase family protein [Aeromicrobium stalagmiti]NRQ51161.1 phosphotransferase family protein [Aeromicrobium stalagmiti]